MHKRNTVNPTENVYVRQLQNSSRNQSAIGHRPSRTRYSGPDSRMRAMQAQMVTNPKKEPAVAKTIEMPPFSFDI